MSQATSPRLQRISDMLRRELSVMIQQLDDPRLTMISVMDVKVSRDLSHAKVYISCLEEDKVKEMLAVLNHAAGYLRHQLAQTVELRIIPNLRFYFDDALVRSGRIADLLNEEEKNHPKDEG